MKKIAIAVLAAVLIISSLSISTVSLANPTPRTVSGYVYVNGVVTKPDKVTLSIGTQQVTATLFNDGYYIIDFSEDDGETGTFTVTVDGKNYLAPETVTLLQDVYVYHINLTVDISSANGGGNNNGGNGGGTSGGNNNGGNNNLPPPPPPMNQPPVANAGDPYSGILGVPAEFDASASHDPDGNITGYRWDFDGDGSWDTEWLKTPIATHNYTSTGFYTIILEVKDNQGATDTDSTSALIEESFNYPPTTPVISGPSTGYVNTSYNFTAVSTDNDSATLQYTFNWGDGETTTTEFVPNGTAVHLNHTWHVPGNYTIQVMAYDNNTVSGTATHYVEITVTSEEPTNNSGSVTSQDYTVYYVAVILIILLILIFLLGRKKKKT